jgi:hypothetical protein
MGVWRVSTWAEAATNLVENRNVVAATDWYMVIEEDLAAGSTLIGLCNRYE